MFFKTVEHILFGLVPYGLRILTDQTALFKGGDGNSFSVLTVSICAENHIFRALAEYNLAFITVSRNKAFGSFIGKQGAGKSSLAQVLGGEWVTNSAIDINSKDGYIALQGKWIVEIAEMNSFSKKEASSVKSYISSSTDSYRPPYGQHNVDVKRQCIFFGTTNDILCLADSTGNRRFWPVECNATEIDAFERIQVDVYDDPCQMRTVIRGTVRVLPPDFRF